MKERNSTINPAIESIITLLYTPKNRVIVIPSIITPEQINLSLSVQTEQILLHPIKRDKDIIKRIVETVNKTENFRRFRMNKETIDKIPDNNAHPAHIPKPIILSPYVSEKQESSSGLAISTTVFNTSAIKKMKNRRKMIK